ncbi:MAG: hypothetical protein JNK00_05375 [Flavipsychrobacter sp.]|nr:hypothetical protein [Flavipsychrobacter sp.]
MRRKNYRNRSQAKRIYKWVNDTIRSKVWDNDLHIDVVNRRYDLGKHQYLWIDSAVAYYLIAKQYVEKQELPFQVILVIELEYKDVIGDYPVYSKQELEKELCNTPPSLYLYKKDEISNHLNEMKELPNFLLSDVNTKLYYYQRVDEECSEVDRWMYLV